MILGEALNEIKILKEEVKNIEFDSRWKKLIFSEQGLPFNNQNHLNNLLIEYEKKLERLTYLQKCVAVTNNVTTIDRKGTTITALKASCEAEKVRCDVLNRLFLEVSLMQHRRTKQEIKLRNTVTVREAHRLLSSSAKNLRLLNTRLGRIVWETSLIETAKVS